MNREVYAMKSAKRIISVLLVFAMLTGIVSVSAFAADAPEYKNSCPVVLVHGMFGWGANEGINNLIPYWGSTGGYLIDYLRDEGYDCYSASVGPLSSAWDQACELYAQLMGIKVDYGAAHSSAEGHDRYGRDYPEPLFEGWGKSVEKIHLVGHSFGGNAVRLLTHLLTYGCPEEMNACDDPSPLFEGGHGDMIASCTAICTPLNGTTCYNVARIRNLIFPLKLFVTLWAGFFGRSVFNGRLVDFHLEQFGLSAVPGTIQKAPFYKSVKNFLNSDDCVQSGLSIADCGELNDLIETNPDVYYFSLAYDCTQVNKKGKTVPKNYDLFLLAIFSSWMIDLGEFTDEDSGIKVDESWLPNDGLVNVVSARYPFDEAHKDYDPQNVEKGMWNVLPVRTGDHGTPIGLFADNNETRELYKELFDMLIAIE